MCYTNVVLLLFICIVTTVTSFTTGTTNAAATAVVDTSSVSMLCYIADPGKSTVTLTDSETTSKASTPSVTMAEQPTESSPMSHLNKTEHLDASRGSSAATVAQIAGIVIGITVGVTVTAALLAVLVFRTQSKSFYIKRNSLISLWQTFLFLLSLVWFDLDVWIIVVCISSFIVFHNFFFQIIFVIQI